MDHRVYRKSMLMRVLPLSEKEKSKKQRRTIVSLMALTKLTLELSFLSRTNFVYQMDPFAENSNTTWTSNKKAIIWRYWRINRTESDVKYTLTWSRVMAFSTSRSSSFMAFSLSLSTVHMVHTVVRGTPKAIFTLFQHCRTRKVKSDNVKHWRKCGSS